MFSKYVSNVPLGTGTNFILSFGGDRRVRARAYFRVEMSGTFDYRIFYINSVNSTYDQGAVAYRNRSGGHFRIVSASLADGGPIGSADAERLIKESHHESLPPLDGAVTLTFDGETSRDVTPDEHIVSDPVRLTIPDGHYLAFEWEIIGDGIPCTPDSRALTFVDTGDGYSAADGIPCPLPAMFACDRPYRKRIAFLGDSITQGCGTGRNLYGMWAGRIAAMMPENAVWNLGLGWGRGSDMLAPKDNDTGSWLWKAMQNDVVILTYGVNDLLSGRYRENASERRPDTAGEVVATICGLIEKLQDAGVEVILSTVPPFDYSPAAKNEWRAVNLAIPRIAELCGCRVYDIEAALDSSSALGNDYPYGAHPDEKGGEVAAEAFRKRFLNGGLKTF